MSKSAAILRSTRRLLRAIIWRAVCFTVLISLLASPLGAVSAQAAGGPQNAASGTGTQADDFPPTPTPTPTLLPEATSITPAAAAPVDLPVDPSTSITATSVIASPALTVDPALVELPSATPTPMATLASETTPEVSALPLQAEPAITSQMGQQVKGVCIFTGHVITTVKISVLISRRTILPGV
jgi:hypothetical protein